MRIKNMLIATSINAVIVLPFLWMNKLALYQYYVIGHILNNEKYIRSREVGITSNWSNITFYFQSIFSDHLGKRFLHASLLLLLGILAIVAASKYYCKSKRATVCLASGHAGATLFFIALAFIVPIIILTADISKSPVVGGVAVVPFIWLIVWMLIKISNLGLPKIALDRYLTVAMLAVFISGFSVYIKNIKKPYYVTHMNNIVEMNTMYETIGHYVKAAGRQGSKLATDRMEDYFASYAIASYYYEHHKILLNIIPTKLGGSIFSISKQEALDTLRQSDIIILNQLPYASASFSFPSDQSMVPLYPQMKAIAAQKFIKLGDFNFNHAMYSVYVKPYS